MHTFFARIARAGLLGLALVLSLAAATAAAQQAAPRIADIDAADLPREGRATIELIRKGGPFPYPQKDGTTFGNFEKRLPLRERGYYREYTVPTPGAKNRGARRIVAGRDGELYYTDDHYNSFKRIRQ